MICRRSGPTCSARWPPRVPSPRTAPCGTSSPPRVSVPRNYAWYGWAWRNCPTTVTLVLDDFHLISNRLVVDSVGQLLEHQPPQLRLVLTTRADPALRLHRLRVSGGVTDLRADDLAFTPAEAAELLHRNGIHPSQTQLDALLDRTEGWAAGLRLAVMGLDPADADDGIAGFTGNDRLVAEYLIEEVLDRLPATDRQFLLTTSVADRVSAALANELTGRADGQLVLDRLVAQNALLVGLAGRTEWFRFHPMLRDLLVHRLTWNGRVPCTTCTCGRRGGSPPTGNRSLRSGMPPPPGRGTRSAGCSRTSPGLSSSPRAGPPWCPRSDPPRTGPRSTPPPALCWPRRCGTSTGTTSKRCCGTATTPPTC